MERFSTGSTQRSPVGRRRRRVAQEESTHLIATFLRNYFKLSLGHFTQWGVRQISGGRCLSQIRDPLVAVRRFLLSAESAPYGVVGNAKQTTRRVLIVDDEPDFLQLMSFSLEERGYRVLTACNGLEAVLKARRAQPDAVIMDLMMPGLDGYSACEILRRQLSTRSLPIIVVTAANSEFSRLNALAAGANDFMTKPFSPQELVKRVSHLVEQSTARQRLEAERGRLDSESFPS